MELSTVQRLAELNRRFYEEHAENFADSRPRLNPGVRRVLERIHAGARVLEVGCGDGKVARALPPVDYTGLDQSEALLRRAEEYTTKDERRRTKDEPFVLRPSSFVWFQADLLAPETLPSETYDFILAFAVFHHLPGRAQRQTVLARLAQCLAAGGVFAMSNWQFHTSPRLLERRAPWEAIGLTAADVEPGDALLTWERKGRTGLRYVHALDNAEAEALMTATGLEPVETFTADGHTGNLAAYVVARRGAPHAPLPAGGSVSDVKCSATNFTNLHEGR
jgi:tRNA (uracil-5-)-methyltransferase TRM9